MKQPVNCKYTPFETYLRELSATQSALTLTFEQIEVAMNSLLPKSAHERLTWWDNEVHSTLSHKNAWLNAGWKVDTVNLFEKWVRFVRNPS
jgi:hypothetical protein